MVEFFEKLKVKWGIENNLQILAILLVFSLAGPTVILLKGIYFDFLGFSEETHWTTKTIAYILFIFPAYQVLLLIYGALLGQFKFFWAKEKLLFQKIFGKRERG